MREDLGKELARSAQQAARRIAPAIVRGGSKEVKDLSKYPSTVAGSEVVSAPALNAYAGLAAKPLAAGTLALVNRSTGAEYAAGTDFVEDAVGGRFQNLAIPAGTSLDALYHYFKGGGGGVTDHGALTGLGDDDHPIYHTDARGDARYVNEADHTKAAHDAMGIDAATLDGIDSTALQTRSEKGQASGYAPLDASSLVPEVHIPAVAISDTYEVATEAAMLALTAQRGDVAIRSDLNKSFILRAAPASTLANWSELRTPTDAVLSVDGRTGAVTLSDLYKAIGYVPAWTEVTGKPATFPPDAHNQALSTITGHDKAAHDALLLDAATLDGIDSTGFAPASHVGSRNGHPVATTALDGLMAAADKGKLDRALDVETSQRVVYVSPTGSDTTGDGTTGNRWKTIQHAINQARAFMQPRNGTSAYKIVCATGTYNEAFAVPANAFASFGYGGLGGIWITSETGVAADVILSSGATTVYVYGSCTLEDLTIEGDSIAVYAVGGPSVLAYLRDCVLRRKTVANGGSAAVYADGGRAAVHNCSSVTGQLFTYGLQARIGSVIAKVGVVPAGATANEFVQYGGVIR